MIIFFLLVFKTAFCKFFFTKITAKKILRVASKKYNGVYTNEAIKTRNKFMSHDPHQSAVRLTELQLFLPQLTPTRNLFFIKNFDLGF